jgi:hypothetical protein
VSESRHYHYRDAVNGFFEFPTANARTLLPRGVQPVESHHGLSILTVTGFEFERSEVGSYRELVLSIVAAPRIQSGELMPRSALYPFMVGTTTPESRRHGMEVWKLPHLQADLQVDFDRQEDEVRIRAAQGGSPILELHVTAPRQLPWKEVEHRYQTFSRDESGLYVSNLVMQGSFLEHEEEKGSLVLHPHAFTAGVDLAEVTTTPFREQWMRSGLEVIHPLQPLQAFVER